MIYFADLTSITTSFSTAFSIIATLAAVVLGFLSAKQKVTVVALEESNQAYASLHATDKLQNDALTEQIKLTAQKAEVLENQITQAPSINELAVQLATQHKDMMIAMGKMTKELGNVAKAVSKDA